jgi:hypothetical protein
MREHPRSLACRRASVEFGNFWIDFVERHGLTPTEMLQILTDRAAQTLKYCLRAERHPDDPSRPADVV